MKRNPYNTVFLISLVIGSLGLLAGLARAQSPDNLTPDRFNRGQSCATPAANWATLTACRTQTAQAAMATSTQTPQATPTRIAIQIIYCASQPDVTQIEPGLWRIICKYR